MNLKPQNPSIPAFVTGLLFTLICLFLPDASSAQVLATISNPPQKRERGSGINITTTVWNSGTNMTSSATVHFSLVRVDFAIPESTPLGSRFAPALGGGEISQENTQVTIPSSTSPGTYKIKACVGSSCKTSNGTMMVTRAFIVTLRVVFSGAGRGCATAGLEFMPPRIDICGGSSSMNVSEGQIVVFAARPLPASIIVRDFWGRILPPPPSIFTGWSGDCSGGSLIITKTPGSDMTCTANFKYP